MAKQDGPISVEFRFPQKGVNAQASRDRMLVSEAVEMINVRRRQRLTSAPSLSESPTDGGGSRGGLKLWNTTSGNPSHVGSWLDAAGNRQMAIFCLNSPNVVDCGAAGYSTSLTPLTSNATTFPQSQVRTAQFGGKLYVVGPNGSAKPVGGIVSGPVFGVGAFALASWALPANMFGTQNELQGPTAVAFFKASAWHANRRSNQYIVSKVGDPLDYNYGASPVITSAYLGNSSGIAGVPGEPILELAGFRDDYLAFLCESSVWEINGDPRSGGRVQMRSGEVGVQTPQSGQGTVGYATDSEGRLWFVGSTGKGLFMKQPGLPPVNVTDDRVRRFFRDTWGAANLLSLAYDADGDNIVLCPSAPTTVFGYSALVYNIPSGRWSVDTFPSSAAYLVFNNPVKAQGGGVRPTHLLGQGNAPGLLFLDDNTSTDRLNNGAGVITTPGFVPTIRYAPIQLGEVESMCLDLSAQCERGCGRVNWYWLTADSPADLLELSHTDAVVSGSFFTSGDTRDRVASVRATGVAHQLIIRGATASDMRLQRFIARFEPRGRVRL